MFEHAPVQMPVTPTFGLGVPVIVALTWSPIRLPPTLAPQLFRVNVEFPMVRFSLTMKHALGLPAPATDVAPGVMLNQPRICPKNVSVGSEMMASTYRSLAAKGPDDGPRLMTTLVVPP